MALTSDESWCLIENDRGVFTELINKFGCQGVEVEELFSFDLEHLEHLKPIYGLIFLFKWLPKLNSDDCVEKDEKKLKQIFFAKQMVNNACATQALLSVLLNCTYPDVEIGPMLREFKDFCKDLDPEMKGLSLANSEAIRNVHNSFNELQSWYKFENGQEEKKEQAIQLIAYVPIDGRLYEIDGLQSGPILLAVFEKDVDWLDVVRQFIFKKIQKCDKDETHFNLMAVISDLKMKYERQLVVLEKSKKKFNRKYNKIIQQQVDKLKVMIKEQDLKRHRYREDNLRRQHNYLSIIISLMKMAGRQGQLVDLYENAKSNANKLLFSG